MVCVQRWSLRLSQCVHTTLLLFISVCNLSHALTIGTPFDKCYKKAVKRNDGVLRDGEFPWFVAVVDEEDALLCSGSLVGSRFVVTTSLCGENYLARAVILNYRCDDADGVAPNCGHAKERIAIAETYFETALGLLVLERAPTSVRPDQSAWPDVGGAHLKSLRKKAPMWLVGGGRSEDYYGPKPVQKQSLKFRSKKKCRNLGYREAREGYLCFSPFCGGPCPGDGGGPVVTTNDEGKDVVVGVLTTSPGFLPEGCESKRREPEGYFTVQAATRLILSVTCSSEPKEAWCPEGDVIHPPGRPDPIGGQDEGGDGDPPTGPSPGGSPFPPSSPTPALPTVNPTRAPVIPPPSPNPPPGTTSSLGPLDVHNVILDCDGNVGFQENPDKPSTDSADVLMIRVYETYGSSPSRIMGQATVDFSYSGTKPVILALQAYESTAWTIDVGNRPPNTETALQSVLVFGYESQSVQIVDGPWAVNTIPTRVLTYEDGTDPNNLCGYCNLAKMNAAVAHLTGGVQYTTFHNCYEATQFQYRNIFARPTPPSPTPPTPTPPTPTPPTPTPPTPTPPTPTPPTDPNDLPIGPSPGSGTPPTPTPPTPAPPTPGDPPLGPSPGTNPEPPSNGSPTPPNDSPVPIDPPVGPAPGPLPPGFIGDFFLPVP